MRRIVSGIMLILPFVFMLTLVFSIQPVEASETIYIRADGSIEGTTDISTVDNVTYTFTDNIYNEIVVERDNIIVDGAGYTLQGTGSGNGIDLSGRNNLTIRNLEIEAFSYGIWLSHSSNNSISGNNIINNGGGIPVIHSSNHNNVYGNNITANKWIALEVGASSNYNSIYKNNITNNNKGIEVYWSSNYNTISGNDIIKNGNGITLYGAANYNTISGNNIADNSGIGIWLRGCSSNVIYHNNFVDNTNQVIVTAESANIWDNGYPSGGNYWSDYTGVDLFSGPAQDEAGSDGIWDSPYVIDYDNVDRYPFTQQDGWEAPSIPPDLTVFHPEIDELTVTVNGVVLPGTPGTIITRIHWDWGDGNSEDHWFPTSYTYTDYGDYTITVTAYQSDGLTSTKTKQVSLRQPTPIPEVPLGTILLTAIAFVAYVAVAKWRRKPK